MGNNSGINMKVSDIYINNKLSIFEKKYYPIIKFKNKIIWIPGMFITTIKPQINELKQDYSKIKILDIGSYYGVFLNILEENNIEAVGIELSKHAIEYSSRNKCRR